MHFYTNFPPKLQMWFVEACAECNLDQTTPDARYAIFPKRFYKTVEAYPKEKSIDFCFIGGLCTDKKTIDNRKWIISFINKKFSSASYLQFTDKRTKEFHKNLGTFDYTHEKKGFVPKEHPIEDRNYFDQDYFMTMCRSKFTLCPAGDAFYSIRFLEALMCQSIPVVNDIDETFRSREESLLDYKYYLTTDTIVYREDWVIHNFEIFLKYHTFDQR